MNDQELDRFMRRVLLDSLRDDEASSGESPAPFVPSRNYQRQMKAMLNDPLKWLRDKTKPVWKRVAQKVAVVFLVASVSLGTLMAVSPTVRATVIRWVTEWYETHITYKYAGSAIQENMPRYEIGDLPEGYEEDIEERIEETNYIQIAYRNSLNPGSQTIYFDYTYMQQGSGVDFSTENANVLQVSVNGMSGVLFIAEDVENMWSTLTWIDERANLQFNIDAAMKSDDIIHMAESVKLVETLK